MRYNINLDISCIWYEVEKSAVFFKTKEKYGGLSNFAGGYPIVVNGLTWLTSEALYQACRFPLLPEVQLKIQQAKSPMTAKMISKKYKEDTRQDWEQVRVLIMHWCLAIKLCQNFTGFRAALLETGQLAIVEKSRRDDFWGAVEYKDSPNKLCGQNILGKLLTCLRAEVELLGNNSFKDVRPPIIERFRLNGNTVGVVGPTINRETLFSLSA